MRKAAYAFGHIAPNTQEVSSPAGGSGDRRGSVAVGAGRGIRPEALARRGRRRQREVAGGFCAGRRGFRRTSCRATLPEPGLDRNRAQAQPASGLPLAHFCSAPGVDKPLPGCRAPRTGLAMAFSSGQSAHPGPGALSICAESAFRPFSLMMGVRKRAFRGVFIEENAHRSRSPRLHLQGKWSSVCGTAGVPPSLRRCAAPPGRSATERAAH